MIIGSRSRKRGWRSRSNALGAFAAVLVGLSSSSVAQGEPAALDRLEIADRGSQFFVADSLELAAPVRGSRWAAGAVATYAHRLRTFGSASEGERSHLVEHALVMHPGASAVIAPGARFAVDMPFVLQSGQQTNLARTAYFEPASPTLGDLRVGFDVRVLGRAATEPLREPDGASLASGVRAWLPTGSRDSYTSDGYVRVDFHVASAYRAGPILAAARLGYMYRREAEPFGAVSLGSEARAEGAIGWRSGPFVFGPELHGSTILRDVFKRKSTPIETLLGAHAAFGDLHAGIGIGTAIVTGFGSSYVRAFTLLEWVPGLSARPSDRDDDGVPDDEDVCPDVADPRSGRPLNDSGDAGRRGCPDAPRDIDHDGIVDGEDACPDLAGIRTLDPMTHGCPDFDGDGIPDPVDACPEVPGTRSPIPRFHGCPAGAEPPPEQAPAGDPER